MRRYAVSLSYVGTRFRGWARQPDGVLSVCGVVDDALDALVTMKKKGGERNECCTRVGIQTWRMASFVSNLPAQATTANSAAFIQIRSCNLVSKLACSQS